jgi:glycerol-3-phosphate dehydrogenase (NAD(P)+)
VKISVFGAGAWGTALAAAVAERHDALLWARDAAQAACIAGARRNERYLPDVALPASLRVTADFTEAVRHASEGLMLVATPMSGLREMLSCLLVDAARAPAVMWLSKGFEEGTGLLGHEIAHALRADVPVGIVSGPSFALEVALARPTALVAASSDADLADMAVKALHSESLRVYTSDDPVGVEVGGAIKNVLAVATGIADGMGLGQNARAALVTRGLAEMTRLGVALGARPETFTGLSGLGDLVLTATGDLSRNRKVGLLLAQGVPLAGILAQLGHVAEGVRSAATALQRARRCAVEMPITEAVVDVLDGSATPQQAVGRLMRRDARSEIEIDR